VSSVKILGVVISNNFSVCGHVNNIITSSAQSVHALHVLRSHGMSAECIRTINRVVVIGKLIYASSAWWGFTIDIMNMGFTTAADRQRRKQLYPSRCSRWAVRPKLVDQGLIQVCSRGESPPWKFGTNPGILPRKFLKYGSFFIYIPLSVSFEGVGPVNIHIE